MLEYESTSHKAANMRILQVCTEMISLKKISVDCVGKNRVFWFKLDGRNMTANYDCTQFIVFIIR